jgi:hypothetical protein
MNLIQKLAAFLLLTAILLFAGCQEEELSEPVYNPLIPSNLQRDLSALEKIEQFTETESDFIKITLAKSLAETASDVRVRQLIKDEIMKEFDGDYNVLFNTIKHRKIGNLTFAQHLILNLPEWNDTDYTASRKKGRFDKEAVKAYLQNLDIDTDKMPLLQIAVPHRGKTWEPENIHPLTTAVTDNLITDFDKGFDMPAYHHNGTTAILKSDQLPEEPVLVVSENERLVVLSKNANAREMICLEAIYMEDNFYTYYHGDQYSRYCIGDPIAGPTPTPTPTPTGCDRDRKSSTAYEEMRNIEFLSMDKLREAEGWFSGRVELRAIVADYKTSLKGGDTNFTMKFYEKRKEFKTCGIFNCRTDNFDPRRDIFIWDKKEIGDRILVRFYEDNKFSGNEISIKIPFKVKINVFGVEVETGAEISAKIKPKNKLLGDNYVYYCNKVGKRYDNGWLGFEIRPEGM